MKKKRHNQANIAARSDLINALLELLDTKVFSEISISELCSAANVSRMTFYRNYDSKEDIIISHMEEILEQYELEAQKQNNQGMYYDTDNLKHCFFYFSEHKKFLDGLFKCGLGHIFLDALKKYIMKTYSTTNDLKQTIRLQAFAGSLYNIYIYWSENAYEETPLQMADLLSEIFHSIHR